MPRVLKFKKNAVVYFKGERSQNIFLIKEGSVTLVTGEKSSVSTGKRDLKKGEFFGLFSAIGKFPRQEDAVSLSDVEVLAFDEDEFEGLIAKNPRLSLQLMQMLSQELRKVHKKAQMILDTNVEISLADGLFGYAEMYIDKQDSDKAKYVLAQFLQAYPNHAKSEQAHEMLKNIEK